MYLRRWASEQNSRQLLVLSAVGTMDHSLPSRVCSHFGPLHSHFLPLLPLAPLVELTIVKKKISFHAQGGGNAESGNILW